MHDDPNTYWRWDIGGWAVEVWGEDGAYSAVIVDPDDVTVSRIKGRSWHKLVHAAYLAALRLSMMKLEEP